MDTILNLGINDEVAEGLIKGNPDPSFARFVYDSYRRFIQMFSDVVMEVPKHNFEVIIDELKAKKGVKDDIELDVEDMKELVRLFKAYYKEQKGEDFPSDPRAQLMAAVQAVFRSWDNPRANVYRRMHGIPIHGAPQLMFSPWYSATLTPTPVQALRSPATPQQARMFSSASTSSTLRAKMSLQVSAHPAIFPSSRKKCLRFTSSLLQ